MKFTKKQIAIAVILGGVSLFIFIILGIYLATATPATPQMKGMKHGEMPKMDKNNVYLSERARKLAQVIVSPVERKFVPFKIRLYGTVDYDETNLAHITAWVPGRIEKLFVNFTGIEVKEGSPMVDYYSPELIVAQEELIQSLKSFRKLKNTQTSFAKDQSERNVESARTKLRLLGIDHEQINDIENSNEVKEVIQVKAPVSGIVIQKNALEGEYVKEGTEMFRIADLNEVWVQLEAYESDLPGLQLNETVNFQTDAYPGEKFTGRIIFIDPFLNEKTRTASLRLNIDNKDGRLKPGMYVTGEVISMDESGNPPLVIPATAPLITGKRAIVYVQNPDNVGEYQLREVVLGPKVSDYYVVSSGLEKGELVVVHGNFKIDSSAQIQAKPSMMFPKGGKKMKKMNMKM